jgi:hypothetical protein
MNAPREFGIVAGTILYHVVSPLSAVSSVNLTNNVLQPAHSIQTVMKSSKCGNLIHLCGLAI